MAAAQITVDVEWEVKHPLVLEVSYFLYVIGLHSLSAWAAMKAIEVRIAA